MRPASLFRRLLCASAAVFAAAAGAQAQQVPEHDLKAAFIYNFVQFTQWPKDTLKGPSLTVCASQGSALYMALQAVSGKVVNERRIVLLPLADANAGDCQVVVATEGDRPRVAAIRRASEGGAVLTVTDDADLIREGMMIGMAVDAGRMSFIVDNTRAGRAGLVISSRLLRLAKSVQ
ncbi:YfiR family protein [Azospira restricta]|uniref:YfiR family protein n=1 Tax=Azospira restricta TaxID=404405 RepID=A0A974SPM3_9RHOO|nr:YfiR family protein [Azospira restricta]QRJ64089.1 YfiR family protein [Azospira restricta]